MGKSAPAAAGNVASLDEITAAIPIANLSLASEVAGAVRVRRAPENAEAFALLKASIASGGILQPLVYERVGKNALVVVAGNRRLRALRELHADHAAITVPAIDMAELKKRGLTTAEVALATNLTLPPHPVDQYEVLSGLIASSKMSPGDAGARFGLTAHKVAQVLAIGSLCEEVREAWRGGKLNAETATAFTLCRDPAEQARVYAGLVKQGWHIDAHNVRSKFVSKQREVGPMVEFVTPAAYEAAGGKVNRDLFGTDHTVSDVPLIKRLAHDKMLVVCDALIRGDGWGWAVPVEDVKDRYTFGQLDTRDGKRTSEESARIKELEALRDSDVDGAEEADEQLDDLLARIKSRGYSAEARAKSGCFVEIGRDGAVKIEYGRVKPEERKKVEAQQRGKTAKAKKAKAVAGGAAGLISNALMQRMSEWLTNAAEATLAKNGELALAVLIAGFVASGDKAVSVEQRGLWRKREGHDYSGTRKETPLESALAAALDQTPAARIIQLAAIAGAALDFQSWNAEHPPLKDKGVAAIVAALPAATFNKAIDACFDREDYFKSVSRDLVVAAAADCKLDKVPAKKADAVTWAVKNIPASWLPPELRSVHYEGPRKTAAPAKVKAAKPKGKVTAAKKKARK